MAVIQLVNPIIIVNNVHISIVPNTFSYTEGYGEQTMKTRSGGGGAVETVYANNVETNISMLKWSVFPTNDIVNLLRSWKALGNVNLIAISDTEFNRDFAFCALTNDYEVKIGADATVELEWHGEPAI